MNRTTLQALALLLGTIATTILAAEWRWEPASTGNYLVIAGPAAPGATEDFSGGNPASRRRTVVEQVRQELR